eukprot:c26613_g3_i1 orf=3-173(-)
MLTEMQLEIATTIFTKKNLPNKGIFGEAVGQFFSTPSQLHGNQVSCNHLTSVVLHMA